MVRKPQPISTYAVSLESVVHSKSLLYVKPMISLDHFILNVFFIDLVDLVLMPQFPNASHFMANIPTFRSAPARAQMITTAHPAGSSAILVP